jgi:hypothetical protein
LPGPEELTDEDGPTVPLFTQPSDFAMRQKEISDITGAHNKKRKALFDGIFPPDLSRKRSWSPVSEP